MRFRRTHAGALREIAQHHRARLVGQHVEQSEADFDRLDARAQLFFASLDAVVVGVACIERVGAGVGGVGSNRAGADS
jgi:hypothetical protein